MRWFYSGSVVKSAGELDRLVKDVLLADDFQLADLQGFSMKRELKRMSDHTDGTYAFPAADGWRRGSVSVPLPNTKVRHASESDAPTLEVPDVYFRPLLATVKAAYEDIAAAQYNFFPFKLYKASPSSAAPAAPAPSDEPEATPTSASPPCERLISEAYNADTFLRLHDEVQVKARSNREPGDSPTLEYAAAPIMLYSDSTHLTNFGTASLWPIYLWLASLSKYVRMTPTAFATHHLAYMPSLPDLIEQAYEQAYGESPTKAVLRFCKKELIQQIWLLLLDDDFVHAYVHGFVVKCGDGITRRLFPRILTYSADYPEKCLIACIKTLGRCPCPACLIKKVDIHLMGTKKDMATRTLKRRTDTFNLRAMVARVRDWIFRLAVAPEGKYVEAVIGATSTSPTQSAFSRRLAEFGFDVYRILVPDVLHEVELGVWKATITHLVRILAVIGLSAINHLNARYCSVDLHGCLVLTMPSP
ncbi:hypothetical protein C8Q77DRAFT_1062500 [Trametes polyzona]|nr:hypothetical protein C8Q77DRAFT_1062500 [Trametes polyzona]